MSQYGVREPPVLLSQRLYHSNDQAKRQMGYRVDNVWLSSHRENH